MKKKNDWIKKGILDHSFTGYALLHIYGVPGIHKTMSRIFKMFASGDFTVVRDFVAVIWGICGTDIFLVDDFSVNRSTASGIFNYICQCQPVWLVERCDPFMEQCNGGSSSMLLYCKNIRT